MFFFNDTATTEIYSVGHTLSLHDALPIFLGREIAVDQGLRDAELLGQRTRRPLEADLGKKSRRLLDEAPTPCAGRQASRGGAGPFGGCRTHRPGQAALQNRKWALDRKSTRLNSRP